MSDRRSFLHQSAALIGGVFAASAIDPWVHAASHIPSLNYSGIEDMEEDE